MLRAVTVRLGIFAVSLVVASVVIFWVTQALPGDVARVLLGDGASEASLAAKRAQLGTDRPLVVQYLDWATGMLRGDFGRSWLSGQSVSGLIVPRLGVTAWLVVLGLGLAVALAVPLGAVAALRRRRWPGFVASAAAQVGMAVPAFWAGILLVVAFAVTLQWLPANGYVPLRQDPVGWASHLVLPVLALGTVQGAVLIRYVRSAFLEVISEDYFRTARSVGWTRWGALTRHGLRNAAVTLITVVGLQLSAVLVGAVVIERVFVLPGLGTLLLGSVNSYDLIVVRGVVMLLVAAALVINAVVDVSYVLLDPRIHHQETR
ncbi:MAG: ABC transporter permease [Propioniciclava sp.]